MLQVGVIGVGYLGSLHARVLSQLDDVRLVGVADVVSERAEKVANKYGCSGFTDYKELLPLTDAVVIATPTTTHYEIALRCLKENKDIFIEKPITATVDEADRLIEEALQREKILQVGHLERFNPAVIIAEEYIDRPLFFESIRVSPYLQRGIDVDITLDLMIHDIDIILALTKSRVVEVYATGAKVLTDKIDVAKAWLVMEDGSQVLATASRLSSERKRMLKIFQRSGMLQIDYLHSEITLFCKGSDGTIQHRTLKPAYREPIKEELREFVVSATQRRPPRVDGIHAREALKVALEISRRIEHG